MSFIFKRKIVIKNRNTHKEIFYNINIIFNLYYSSYNRALNIFIEKKIMKVKILLRIGYNITIECYFFSPVIIHKSYLCIYLTNAFSCLLAYNIHIFHFKNYSLTGL